MQLLIEAQHPLPSPHLVGCYVIGIIIGPHHHLRHHIVVVDIVVIDIAVVNIVPRRATNQMTDRIPFTTPSFG